MKKPYTIFRILLIFAVLLIVNSAAAQDYHSVNREFTISAGSTLEADIKVNLGRLFIYKGRLANTGRLNVYYDAEQYDFDFFFDETYSELYVTLEKEKYFEGFRDSKDLDDTAELTVYLPGNRNSNLDLSVKAGTMDLDLGGIPLTNLSIASWVSKARIRFDEPNPVPLEYVKIDINVGDVRIYNFGNANFRDAIIDGGIGQLIIDLNGSYSKGNHFITIDMDVGEVDITPPGNVEYRIRVNKWPLVSHLTIDRRLEKRGKYYYSRYFDDAETTLTINVDIGIGECIIR